MTKSGAPDISSQQHTQSPPLCTLKNVLFSLLFLVPFIAIAWFGGSSIHIILDANMKPNTLSIDNNTLTDEAYDGNKGARFILGVLVMVIVSCLWAVLLLCITLHLGIRAIKFIFVLFILLAVFGGVIMFADENDELFGVMLMLLAVAAVIFFLSVRNKLDFVRANLRVACAVVLTSTTMIYLSVATLLVLLLWSIFWVIAVYAFSTNDGQTSLTYQGDTYPFVQCTTYFVGSHALANFNATTEVELPSQLVDCEEELDGCSSCFYLDQFVRDGECFTPIVSTLHVALFLLCFYYVSLVLAHVVHTASALVTIQWWLQGRASSSHILSAYKQACSRCLGPICIGSLLVPPIRTLYSAVHTTMLLLDVDVTSGRPHKSNPSPHFVRLAALLHSILTTLENSVISYNRYAFSYLVMHESQQDFMEASQGVAALFAGRGFTSLVHDTVLENVLMLACTSSGILVMLLATLYTTLVEGDAALQEDNINSLLPLCCFVLGYLTSLLVLQVLLGASSALYVCLAENPDALQTHHPQFFEPFVSAWRKHYPEANITIANNSSLGGSSFSVDVFPTAYVPPAVPLARMDTQASSSSMSRGGGRKQLQKYQMISGEGSDDSDSGSDHAEDEVTETGAPAQQQQRASSREGAGAGVCVDSVLESYVASQLQLPSQPNIKLFSSPERAKHPEIFDNEDNEFVL
jgi:hypothetical protein